MRGARAAGCRLLRTWLSGREAGRLRQAGGPAAGEKIGCRQGSGLGDWIRVGRAKPLRGARGRAGECAPRPPAGFTSERRPWRRRRRRRPRRDPGQRGAPRSGGASRLPGPRRRGPRVMAKGEGSESGSAAGLLPTSILQGAERPAQVKVRPPPPREEGWGVEGKLRWGRRGRGLVLDAWD